MIGWTARRLLSELPTVAPDIGTITWTSYVPAPGLAFRLGGTIETVAPTIEPLRFVREALHHRGDAKPITELRVETLAKALAADPPQGRVRGVCSRITFRNGQRANLPLLDFRCEVTEANANAILEALRLIGEGRGVLLNSGRSFHYYGLVPRHKDGWSRFMSFAILLAPLVDTRYVAHCLIEGVGCLRVDSHPAHPCEPVVVKALC
jgi:hypothetical protein